MDNRVIAYHNYSPEWRAGTPFNERVSAHAWKMTPRKGAAFKQRCYYLGCLGEHLWITN